MNYTIKIEAFEGPFDLLFHLIDKNEIDIYDIPINQITEQYLKYIYAMEELDLDITSEFLVMAATLIEIKSKMLLPKDVSKEKDEEGDADPRSDLVKKLLEYKKYKAVAQQFKQREEHYSKVYFKAKEEIIINNDKEDNILENLDISDLINTLSKLSLNNEEINNNIINNHMRQIERDPVTIEDKVKEIIYILEKSHKISFEDLLKASRDKIEAIVTFLAVLELIRMKKIKVTQDFSFSNIFIELNQ